MNIFQYDQVVSHRNLETLISEVDVFKDKMKGNAWIGLHDEPDNPIEQFIIDYENQVHDVDNNELSLLSIAFLEKSVDLLTQCIKDAT